jgi:hypothetical protein
LIIIEMMFGMLLSSQNTIKQSVANLRSPI